MEYLEEAIRVDPSYAAPHATLAYLYAIRAYIHVLQPGAAFNKAEVEARLALALDDADTDAHVALGLVQYWLHWKCWVTQTQSNWR